MKGLEMEPVRQNGRGLERQTSIWWTKSVMRNIVSLAGTSGKAEKSCLIWTDLEPAIRPLKAIHHPYIRNFQEWDGTAGKETAPSMYNRDRADWIKSLNPYHCKKCRGRSRNEVYLVVLCKRCKRVLWDTGQLTQHK